MVHSAETAQRLFFPSLLCVSIILIKLPFLQFYPLLSHQSIKLDNKDRFDVLLCSLHKPGITNRFADLQKLIMW